MKISYREQLLKEDHCSAKMTLLPGVKVNGIFFGSLNCPIPLLGRALKTIWGPKSGSLCKSLLSQTGVTTPMILLTRWMYFSVYYIIQSLCKHLFACRKLEKDQPQTELKAKYTRDPATRCLMRVRSVRMSHRCFTLLRSLLLWGLAALNGAHA